jgi:hypothetical protein
MISEDSFDRFFLLFSGTRTTAVALFLSNINEYNMPVLTACPKPDLGKLVATAHRSHVIDEIISSFNVLDRRLSG